MEIIARTNKGFLIQAAEREVKEILTATKIKTLADSYGFTNLMNAIERVVEDAEELKKAVLSASEIEI